MKVLSTDNGPEGRMIEILENHSNTLKSIILLFHPNTRKSPKFSKIIKNLDNNSNTRQSLEYSVIIQKVENQSKSRNQ